MSIREATGDGGIPFHLRTANRGVLLDQERRPRVRDLLGHLLARSATADFAVRRVRLAALDFRPDELRVTRCRVLLGVLDVDALADAAAAGRTHPDRGAALDALRRLIAEGRLEIRSAGTTRWVPDFAVFAGSAGQPAHGAACLVGWLGLDGDTGRAGPRLTSLITAPAAVASAGRRFDELWLQAWDVLDVIATALGPG